MPLTNYSKFLETLRGTWSRTRAVRRIEKNFSGGRQLSDQAEALEVRLVPAAMPVLTITPLVTVAEGNSGTQAAVFTVTLSAASQNPISVDYSTANGTATVANGDYATEVGTLMFAAGETSKTITVDVTGDTRREADESFSLVLYNAINAKLKAKDSIATGKITNDDALPTVSIGTPATVFEGNTGTKVITFPVTLTNASDQTITVHYATADGTATVAGNDYLAKSGNVTFAPGETTKNVSITIKGDTTAEANETFTVTLTAPTTATLGTAVATGTIGDDDTLPVLSVNNPVSIDEGNTGTVTLLYTVTLSSASTQTVTVAYATADGTATVADNDYTAKSGTLSFAPGETSKIVQVVIKGDTKNEANETLLLNLSGATNANIAVASGTGTITNDDFGLPTVNITPGVTVTEGNSGTVDATFHVTLSQATGQTVTVVVSTTNGTATTADNDYVAGTGTITFAPGETDKTFVVQVKGDTKLEANENFSLVLSSPTNATIGTTSAAATITNDDSGVVSIAKTKDGAETTPPTVGKFTVTQSGTSSIATVLTYTVAGTALPGAGNDYQTLSGTVTIPAGQTTATIDVTTLTDATAEDLETVIVTLTGFTSHDPNITLDPVTDHLTATLNIVDASQLPGLAIGGPAVTYQANGPAVSVLPLATVNDTPLSGGVLSISIPVVRSSATKALDQVKFPSTTALGTSTGPTLVEGTLSLTVDLKQGVTAADIQAFLRGITFSTKGLGLQTATRTMNVTLSDSAQHTSVISQTINIQNS